MTDIRLTKKTVGILTAGTWPQWSRKCRAVLRSNGLWTYINGDEQNPPMEEGDIPGWTETNDQIVGALCQVVEGHLVQEIENFTSASKAWQHLKTRTYSKSDALQSVMRLRFTGTGTASSILTDLKDHMDAIYSDEAPTKDEWMVGILLHAMCGSDLDGLRKNLMASSTELTPTTIIQHIEGKVQEARHREQIKKR